VSSSLVSETEAEIRSCVEKQRPQSGPWPAYNLQDGPSSGGQQVVPLEREMHEELLGSWDAYHASPKPSIKLTAKRLREFIAAWQVGPLHPHAQPRLVSCSSPLSPP